MRGCVKFRFFVPRRALSDICCSFMFISQVFLVFVSVLDVNLKSMSLIVFLLYDCCARSGHSGVLDPSAIMT